MPLDTGSRFFDGLVVAAALLNNLELVTFDMRLARIYNRLKGWT